MGSPELLGTWRCRCAKFGPIPEATQVFILLYLLTHDTFSDLHPEFIWLSMDHLHPRAVTVQLSRPCHLNQLESLLTYVSVYFTYYLENPKPIKVTVLG
jgi:hypothetical protein